MVINKIKQNESPGNHDVIESLESSQCIEISLYMTKIFSLYITFSTAFAKDLLTGHSQELYNNRRVSRCASVDFFLPYSFVSTTGTDFQLMHTQSYHLHSQIIQKEIQHYCTLAQFTVTKLINNRHKRLHKSIIFFSVFR